jgi:hypothetical protein
MLIEEATYNSTINTTFNRLLSIVEAHQATEWLLKFIAIEKSRPPENDSKKILEIPFSQLSSYVIKVVPETKDIIDKNIMLIERIRVARNSIYHQAIVDIEAAERVGGVQEMLRELCEKVLGVKWEEISLVDEINNDQWKSIAKEAEQALVCNDYVEVLKKSWELVNKVLEESGTLGGETFRTWLLPVYGEEDYKVMVDTNDPAKYAGKYSNPEVKALALDMSKAINMLGFLATTLTFLNEEERLKYAKMANAIVTLKEENSQNKQSIVPTSLEAFDFAVRIALKFERLSGIAKQP